jgi:hypothetical protein
MNFWNLPTLFVTPTKLMGIDFYLQCVSFMCLKLWDIGWIIFLKLKIHRMNGMWFNLLCYGIFLIPFKHFLKIMSYRIMIWNWKWKKMLLSISSKYSYFKQIFNYIRKRFWKGTIICWNCDTLVCFRPTISIE